MRSGPNLVFLIGAPRSGTTWLQRLLGSDPSVVSPQETDVFTRYVRGLDDSWEWATRGSVDDWAQRRFKGLPAVLTDEEFGALVEQFLAGVWSATLALKPGATTIVEKSPSHSRQVALIRTYAPGAKFVHLVRDGRDVAASLVAASSGWGGSWAPSTLSTAAFEWAQHVRGALETRGADDAIEVRYEDLRGENGLEALQRVLAFCGCDSTEAGARDRFEHFDLGRTPAAEPAEPAEPTDAGIVFGGEAAKHANAAREPEGFTGAAVRRWAEWSVSERVAFAERAGSLLVDLGYARDDSWIGTPAEVRRVRRRAGRRQRLARVVAGVGRRLEAGATRID